MPLQEAIQTALLQVGLLEQLLNARLVLGPANTRSDGHNVFGPENFGGHSFVIDSLGLAHGFLSQSAGCKKLHWESTHQQMFAFDLPSLSLKVRINGGNAGSQPSILWDEKNVGVVGGEWFDVVNRRERAAERP